MLINNAIIHLYKFHEKLYKIYRTILLFRNCRIIHPFIEVMMGKWYPILQFKGYTIFICIIFKSNVLINKK